MRLVPPVAYQLVKHLKGETTRSERSGPARITCLLPNSASLECVTCFLEHQVRILNTGAHSELDLMPPYLFMYAAMVTSVAEDDLV